MTMRRLHNDDWGYETDCFVCEQTNESGLRIPFFHDEDNDVVMAEFQLSGTYSGAPTLLHGGVQLAVLDEAMAWATIAVAGQWALTVKSSAEFHAGVHVDVAYRVVARVVDHVDNRIDTAAEIIGSDGTVRTTAQAQFVAIGEAKAADLVGGAINPTHEEFLADAPSSTGEPKG